MSDEQIYPPQPENTPKKDIPTGVKVLLRILSVLLCLCLCASLLATALILDFRLMTSKENIKKIAGTLVSAPVQTRHIPLTAAMGRLRLNETSDTTAQTQEALVEWLYDTLKAQHGDELTVTKEQMESFLDQSGTKDFLTDKISSYMDDFINGTSNTTITTEEVVELIKENKALVEQELGVTMDPQAWDQVIDFVEQSDIGEVIRTEVIEGTQNLTIPGGSPLFPEHAPAGPDPENSAWGGSYTVGALMADLRAITSTTALTISIVVNVLLIVALFFVNRMRLSATLCCAGIPMTVTGSLLALPTALLQLIPNLLPDPIGSTVAVLVGAIAPVHYTMLGLGIGLLIGAIVTKVLRKK